MSAASLPLLTYQVTPIGNVAERERLRDAIYSVAFPGQVLDLPEGMGWFLRYPARWWNSATA